MARTKTLTGLIACALLLAGCSRARAIKVGSKNFTEQVLLGEIVAQHIEKRLGVPIERRLNLGGTLLAHQALINGEVDLYPEYSGTAYTAVLKLDPTSDPGIVFERVRMEYRARMQIEWLDPLGFNNSFVMVVRGDDARTHRLETITDAVNYAEGWKLGVGYEFQERPDGLTCLMRSYKLRWRAAPKSMDLGLLYEALAQKQVTMVAANATDGLLSARDLKVLRDDKSAFPPYQAALAVRAETLAAFPALRPALAELSGKLGDESMRKLNFEVDSKKRPVRDVAAEFLRSTGL